MDEDDFDPEMDDARLWRYVTRNVTPLAPPPAAAMSAVDKPPPVRPAARRLLDSAAPPPRPASPSPANTAPPGLDRRSDERLRRGQMAIDGRIDLHGNTQQQAYSALRSYIASAQAEGKRCILVITGKGREGGEGVLKRRVPQWLAEPDIAAKILRFYPAQKRHGGDGALYVLLRRIR